MESAVISRVTSQTSARRRSAFYVGFAVLSVLVIFVGFARSYYLKATFHSRSLTPLVHVHGLIMTCWMALLVLQSSLVKVHKTHLHRRIGVAGGFLALAAIGSGWMVAIRAVQLGHAPTGVPSLSFLIIPLGDIVTFAVLVTLALFYRRRPEIHKRLMVVSTIAILPPGIARWPWMWVAHYPARFFGVADLILLACVAYDVVRTRRLHPAYLWGGSLLALSHRVQLQLGHTQVWLAFARWITGVR